jgi:hypothetical protein
MVELNRQMWRTPDACVAQTAAWSRALPAAILASLTLQTTALKDYSLDDG